MNMEKVICIICEKSNPSPLYKLKDRFGNQCFHLVECSCGFIYLNPRPSCYQIGDYYTHPSYDPHNENRGIFNYLYSKVRSIVMFYRYVLCRRFVGLQDMNVLEVGGGKGDFCEYLGLKDIKATCQDPNITASDANFNMVSSLDQIKGENIFNCISMWHSIEHIHDIDKLFINIERLAMKDAILFIAIPNKSSIDRHVFREKWVAWDAPRHLYHFSYSDLSKLLSRKGWQIYSSKTLYHDMFYNVLLSLSGKKYKYLQFAIILLFMVPISIINNNYSSSRLYICQRK